MRKAFTRGLAFGLAGLAFVAARDARASSVLEIPDNGSEQMGRGGAWVARASDPLAVFYNPAGLAGQDTRATIQGNVNIQNTCFTRIKAANDTTADGFNAGDTYPQVCSDGAPFPNPQLGFTYRLTPRIGLGIAVLGPSAAGNQNWPENLDGAKTMAPQRYLLLQGKTLLLTPTIGVGIEPVDHFRIGASFLWGIANFDFSNFSVGSNTAGQNPKTDDIHAELKVKQMFVPGFTIGTIWSPTDNIDIAGWYKWMAPVNAKGDVVTTDGIKETPASDSSAPNCGTTNPNYANTCAADQAKVKVPIPMEAKLGVRFHQPRAGVDQAHHRDPLSQDLFDIEANLTWANNSAFDAIHISFPDDGQGNGVIPSPPSFIPPNADVPHNFKDVFGVRIGGDYVVLPDQLSVRAGGYFETRAQDAQWQNIDFAGAQRIGIAAGATYRIHFRPDQAATADTPAKVGNALEIMVGIGHTFIGSTTYNGPGGIVALAGAPCYGGSPPPPGPTCSDGSLKYRAPWAVNLGTITNSFTAINLGLAYRF